MREFAAFSVTLMAVSLLAACGDDDAMSNATETPTATQTIAVEVPPTRASPPPRPASDNIPVGEDGTTLEEALAVAGARAGFAARMPAFLPTPADRATFVNWSAPWEDIPDSGQILWIYVSEETVEVDGRERPAATLTIHMLGVRSDHPGELLSGDLAGYEVYEEQPEEFPESVGYYINYTDGGEYTMIIAFDGDRPMLEDVERMLESFVVVEPAMGLPELTPAPTEEPHGLPPDPVQGRIDLTAGDVSLQRALIEASARAGFAARMPTFLPTAADGATVVEWGAYPSGNTSGPYDFIRWEYTSDATVDLGRGPVPAARIGITLTSKPLWAEGRPLDDDLGGFDVWVAEGPPASEELQASTWYYAHGSGGTMTMVFTGEQPTIEGLERMLESLVVTEPE